LGGFAIGSVKPCPDVRVTTCHVNVWALQSLNWNPVFYYDLGLELTGISGDDAPTLRLHLPFQTESQADLRHVFNDKDTAGLVFGEPVSLLPNPDRLVMKGRKSELYLVEVDHELIKVDAESSATQTVYEVKLKGNFDKARHYYIRMRFVSKSLRDLWQIKRSWFRSNGATVDLRFFDMRDWFKSNDRKPVTDNLLEVDRLQVFVIAPAEYQLRASSPSLKYMRTLERMSWNDYLGRAPAWTRSKFLIYYWDIKHKKKIDQDALPGMSSESIVPISVDEPARLFLDISRDFGFILPWNLIRFGILFAALMLVPWSEVQGWTQTNAKEGVVRALAFVTGLIVGINVFKAAATVFSTAKKLPKFLSMARGIFRKIEDGVMRSKRG
jgi:hypothetical protein